MANSINKGQSEQNFFQMFQSQFNIFAKNPIDFLMKRRINIPQQFQNDPKGAVQHLLNNGQLTESQLNHMMQIAEQAGIKLD